jgi:hypothetical protein
MHYVAAALGALLVVALGKARVARGGKAKNSEEKGD